MFHYLFTSENQCFERIPILYQNELQFVDQVTRQIFPWSIKVLCKSDNFDNQILLDADGDDTYCLTTYPIKARNPVRTFTPDEIENRFTHADFSAQQLGIYSQHDWTKSIDKMNFNQLVDDAAEKFEVAQALNFCRPCKKSKITSTILTLSK